MYCTPYLITSLPGQVTGYLQPCFRASAWIKFGVSSPEIKGRLNFDKAFHSLYLAIANNRGTEYGYSLTDYSVQYCTVQSTIVNHMYHIIVQICISGVGTLK